jgi:hypothetical protein
MTPRKVVLFWFVATTALVAAFGFYTASRSWQIASGGSISASAGSNVTIGPRAVGINNGAIYFSSPDQRAWLMIDDAAVYGDAGFDNNDAIVPIRFTVKNVGSSPAFDVSVKAHLVGSIAADVDPAYEQLQMCRGDEARFERSDRTIFHNRSAVLTHATRIKPEEVASLRSTGASNSFLAHIVGCVVYATNLGGPIHTTGFLYHVIVRNEDKGDLTLHFERQIEADRIFLRVNAALSPAN